MFSRINFLVCLYSLASVLVFFAIVKTQGQQQPAAIGSQRAELVAIRDKEGKEAFQYLESHALLIGVSKYKYWNTILGVESDIEAVDSILKRHGFKNERLPNPKTGEELYQGLNRFFARYGHKRNNRLLIYYAGHGATLLNDDDENNNSGDAKYIGYLVPAEAPLTTDIARFRELAFSIRRFHEFSEESSARHIMFVFDSCFSGWVLDRDGETSASKYINELTAKPVRQFITAGRKDQTVPDESIFRRKFVEALQGRGDTSRDGYITGDELMEHLKKEVTDAPNSKQNPQSARIDQYNHREGDFVFVVPTEFVSVRQNESSFIKAEPPKAIFLRALGQANREKKTETVAVLQELAKQQGATDAEIDSVLKSTTETSTEATTGGTKAVKQSFENVEPYDYDKRRSFVTRKVLATNLSAQLTDGVPGRHSPFTEQLLETLRRGRPDGVVTSASLAAGMERLSPAPTFGTFGSNEPGSDFLFVSTTGSSNSAKPVKRTGKDYALLIATNEYQRWPSLSSPIDSAKALADELRNNYGFETEVLQNPARDDIVAALRKYRDRIYSDDDQLMVFFAGHGYYSEEFKEGFIVTRDSSNGIEPFVETTTLSNSILAKILDVTRCKHIFLILDTPSNLKTRLNR